MRLAVNDRDRNGYLEAREINRDKEKLARRLISPSRTPLFSLSLSDVKKYWLPPTSERCTSLLRRASSFHASSRRSGKRALPTHRIAEIRNSRTRRRQKYILGGFVVGLVVVPPERSNAPRAQPPPPPYFHRHHHGSI